MKNFLSKNGLKLPKGIRPQSKKLVMDLQVQHGIEDAFGIELLRRLAILHSEILRHEATLDREGWTYTDRFNKPKSHPLAPILRDTRSQFLQTLKSLNLDTEPVLEVGRPSGGSRGY